MGTRNNAGECVALESLTFPSQVLPCSGSTGVISAFPLSGKAPRDMYFSTDLSAGEICNLFNQKNHGCKINKRKFKLL